MSQTETPISENNFITITTTKDPNILDPFKDIAEFLHLIKLSNLVGSLQYLGCTLDAIYSDKKEMVIEAYLLLIEQLAIEDFAVFMPPDTLKTLLTSLHLPISESDDTNIEIMLKYLFSTNLSTYLHKTCSWRDLSLLCSHFDIPIDENDQRISIDDEESTDDEENTENDQLNIENPEVIIKKKKLVKIIQAKALRNKYANWIHQELIFRGFRSNLYDQSLAMSREWMRDIKGPVAGSKIVVVERVLGTILNMNEPKDLSEERSLYCEFIASKLRTKPDHVTLTTASSMKRTGKKKKAKTTLKRKPSKLQHAKIPRHLRNSTPIPHPNDYEQDLEYSGGTRDPIIKGVGIEVLMEQYTHAELRAYCSVFRLNQTGKKHELVDRIIDFLDSYDYSKPRAKDSSENTPSLTGKRPFDGNLPKTKKMKTIADTDVSTKSSTSNGNDDDEYTP